MQTSKFLSLNIWDLIKGLIMAVLAAVLVIIKSTVEGGSLDFNWASISQTAIVTAVAYLLKNFLTNTNGEMLKK